MRKIFVFHILLAVLAFKFTYPASASPVVIETVEVTGSRLAENIEELPAPAYVVTKEQIRLSGTRSVQELLTRIPGVTAAAGGASMAQSKGISLRGLNTEVLLLVDGVPTMHAGYGTGPSHGSPFDLRSISPGSIERIEVVKGAGSAIYGSNAAGGVINIITEKGGERGGAVTLEGGGDWFRGSLRGTALLSGDVKVTAGYTRTHEGQLKMRLLPEGNYDKARNFDGDDFLFRVDKGAWTFAAELGDYDSKWDYTWQGQTSENRQENDYKRFLLNYNSGGTSARLYWQLGKREIYDSSGRTDYDDSALGASFSRKSDILGLPSVWGLDWRREKAEYKNSGNPYGNSNPYDLTRDGLAPFLEITVPLGEAALDLGLRYEHWDVDSGAGVSEFIPRLSLSWENPEGGLWYLTVGKFFSMPSFFQMFYSEAYWRPNPDLRPEKGWSYDLGFKNLKARNPWSVNVFHMKMDDRIGYESDLSTWLGHYVNIDKYRAWGAEAEITFNLDEKWAYTQGVSWIKAEEKNAGADWTRSSMPRWDLSGRLNYADGPWSGELALNWMLDRNIKNNRHAYSDEDIFTIDAAIAWKKGGDRIKAACLNLFDRKYVIDSEGYITPERRFVISYERTF